MEREQESGARDANVMETIEEEVIHPGKEADAQEAKVAEDHPEGHPKEPSER